MFLSFRQVISRKVAATYTEYSHSYVKEVSSITKTCPCNKYPLKPHFYIVKLGYAGVELFFLFLLQNRDCGYSLEQPRRGGSNVASYREISAHSAYYMFSQYEYLNVNLVFPTSVFGVGISF